MKNERGDTHNGVGFKAPYRVPLQFGNTVSNADDARSQSADAEKISQSGHKAFVHRCHELEDVSRTQSGAGKRFLLVKRQTLQVLIGTAEGDRVSQCARRRYIVNDAFLRTAKEIIVIELQVLLLRERQTLQIVNGLYVCRINIVRRKHALIIRRIGRQISDVLTQQTLLQRLDFFGRSKFYVVFKYFIHKSVGYELFIVVYKLFIVGYKLFTVEYEPLIMRILKHANYEGISRAPKKISKPPLPHLAAFSTELAKSPHASWMCFTTTLRPKSASAVWMAVRGTPQMPCRLTFCPVSHRFFTLVLTGR